MGDAHSLIKWDGKSHHADLIKTENLLILKAHSKMKYSSIFCNMNPTSVESFIGEVHAQHDQPVVKFNDHFLAHADSQVLLERYLPIWS